MTYYKLRDEIFNRAKNIFDNCEIFIDKGVEREVSLLNSDLNKLTLSESGGISFRGVKGNMEGYAYSEDISVDSIDYLLDTAFQTMSALGEKSEIFMHSDKNTVNKTVNVSEIGTEEQIGLARKMYDAIKATGEEVHQVDSVVSEHRESKFIANTLGLEKYQEVNFAYTYCGVVIKRDDVMKSSYDFAVANTSFELPLEEIAISALKRAKAQFGAAPVESGKYDVIIANSAFAELLSSLCPIFSAKNVQKNMSPFAGKLGEKVGAGNLNIIDSRCIRNSEIETVFDDEGVEVNDLYIVEKGVLKNYVHNLESAKKDGVTSTGNAQRSYKSSAVPLVRNLTVENGVLGFDELLMKLSNGLYITEFQGYHSGLDPISGMFSLPANGFLVENGKITRPVNQILMASNVGELLMSIDDFANDGKICMRGYLPSVLVKGMSISG